MCLMQFILISHKQTFLGCFIGGFFRLFVCLSSLALLLNSKLEFIGSLLTFVLLRLLRLQFFCHIILCRIFTYIWYRVIPCLSELNQRFFKYFKKFFTKSCWLCDLNVVSFLPTNLLLCYYYLYSQHVFDDNNTLAFLKFQQYFYLDSFQSFFLVSPEKAVFTFCSLVVSS